MGLIFNRGSDDGCDHDFEETGRRQRTGAGRYGWTLKEDGVPVLILPLVYEREEVCAKCDKTRWMYEGGSQHHAEWQADKIGDGHPEPNPSAVMEDEDNA